MSVLQEAIDKGMKYHIVIYSTFDASGVTNDWMNTHIGTYKINWDWNFEFLSPKVSNFYFRNTDEAFLFWIVWA